MIAQAHAEYARTPDLSKSDLTMRRYMIASQTEDAADIATIDPQTASMLLGLAVHNALHYVFVSRNRWIPREKDLLAELRSIDPVLARAARAFFASADIPTRIPIAEDIVQHVIGTDRFFEWESPPEEV